jgi:hypothetical protein
MIKARSKSEILGAVMGHTARLATRLDALGEPHGARKGRPVDPARPPKQIFGLTFAANPTASGGRAAERSGADDARSRRRA